MCGDKAARWLGGESPPGNDALFLTGVCLQVESLGGSLVGPMLDSISLLDVSNQLLAVPETSTGSSESKKKNTHNNHNIFNNKTIWREGPLTRK